MSINRAESLFHKIGGNTITYSIRLIKPTPEEGEIIKRTVPIAFCEISGVRVPYLRKDETLTEQYHYVIKGNNNKQSIVFTIGNKRIEIDLDNDTKKIILIEEPLGTVAKVIEVDDEKTPPSEVKQYLELLNLLKAKK